MIERKTFEKAVELAREGKGRILITKELGCSDETARAALVYKSIYTENDDLDLSPEVELEAAFSDFSDGDDESQPLVELEGKNVLILSDIHFPKHDKKSVMFALGYGIREKVDTVYLNGDIIDADKVSRYVSKGKVRSLDEEIRITKDFISKVRQLFPRSEIYFKEGNHEKRIYDYLLNNAPDLVDVVDVSLSKLLGLDDHGVHHVKENQISTIGKLFIVHGHEYKTMFGGGIYHARNTRIKSGENVLLGHFHRTQTDIDRKISEHYIGGWATGCLCKLDPGYIGKSKWNHGFALVLRDGDKFEVRNEIIL